MSKNKYVLKVDLRVLDNLGIKLYSNAAAVLSEAVANAYDADSNLVVLEITDEQIVITDDGVGMALDELNDRFLTVGYDKRNVEGPNSKKGRPFMGRKGIGKLALFSIADEIEVHTTKKGERHSFLMDTIKIRETIEQGRDYFPGPIPFAGEKKGTRIVLRRLKKKRTATAAKALRKRIARRFSVIGHAANKDHPFDVTINDEPVGHQDRDDLRSVEFLWEFGEKAIEGAACPKLKRRFEISDEVKSTGEIWRVTGWLGAVAKPSQLRDGDSGEMNQIVVLSRGRLIQENVLDKLGFNRIMKSYVTGQVDAEFLDMEGLDDIATSDRQRLIEDDDRTAALGEFLRKTLLSIQDQWTQLRNEERGKDAIKENPALQDWLDSLPEGEVQNSAQRVLGLVRGIELQDEVDRRQLYSSAILAFERLRLKESSHVLANLDELTAARVLPLLTDLSVLEGSMYLDIVRGRLDVIGKLKQFADNKEKEKVLQKHLFKNLWLLDAGWERASGSDRVEQTLKKQYKEFGKALTENQSKGRIDIRYMTNAGEHMIIELKKSDRVLKLGELVDQGTKYANALKKCLQTMGIPNPHITIVFVLGRPVAEAADPGGSEQVEKTLAGFNGRVEYYDALVLNAYEQYKEYFDRAAKKDKIAQIIESIGKSEKVKK